MKDFLRFLPLQHFPLHNIELNKHTLILGQTGVGKSKFIELLIKEMMEKEVSQDYSVVIIDPHASLYPSLATLHKSVNIDFINSSCNLFPAFSDPKIATELTLLLLKTLLQDQWNAKIERVLKYSVYTLFIKNQMSPFALRKFLTELAFRKELLVDAGEENDHITHFFETEFVELQTKFYEASIMPLVALIDELSFMPIFSKGSQKNLEAILNNHFLTYFSLNRIF